MKRLIELRKNNNLLQKDIALRIGVDRTTYNKYEKGLSEPSFDTLKMLASFFNVSIDYLLEYDPAACVTLNKPATDAEANLLCAYRSLSAEGRFEVDKFMDYAAERYKKDYLVPNVADK